MEVLNTPANHRFFLIPTINSILLFIRIQMSISIEDTQYGTIKCLAGNTYGAVTTEIELVDNDQKPSIIAPTYREVTAIGGQTVMIPCEAVVDSRPDW